MGERAALGEMTNWVSRPRGPGLKVLLAALSEIGVVIKGSSFDAIELSQPGQLDFSDSVAVRAALPTMTFIEIKTINQERAAVDFAGSFFALTEGEIAASDLLGARHRVVLYDKRTGNLLVTSVPEIVARAKSTNWQLSVQL